MKVYSKYHDIGLKPENEPEEGEIVDDYDLIVSSDEELSMRRRIRELEAENEEIEQIAVISRSYADKIHPFCNHPENSRAAQVPTDVSSISSTEFVTPKKRKREKSRERKRRHCHHHRQRQYHHKCQHARHEHQQEQKLSQKLCSKKSHCKRRQKLVGRNSDRLHSDEYIYKDLNAEAFSNESLASSESSSSLTDTDIYSKHYLSLIRKDNLHEKKAYITRDTLRLAVGRNSNDSRLKPKKSCLKDKLLKRAKVFTANDEIRNSRSNNVEHENDEDDDDVQVIETEPYIQTVDDSTDSMEEKELRLIALKSAVLKKHMARKIRNAEAAYSPTDFDDMLSSDILQQDQKLDDLEIVDLEEDEDSQNACVIISPEASPQLKILDEQEESQQIVDCKPVDMDIANSDSEHSTIGSWPKEMKSTLPPYSMMHQDFSNQFQYNIFMSDFHELSSRPPPPPGVDDYEHAPPPPPYYHHFYNSETQDMELDNEEFTEVHQFSEANTNRSRGIENYEIKELPTGDVCNKEETTDEEEEEALRALLLSKFQSPKYQKKSSKTISSENGKSLTNEPEINENSVNKVQQQTKPTEFILKEAVKRLKIHSQNDYVKGAETVANVNNKTGENSYKETIESKNNCSDSTNLLMTLRDRLLKCNELNETTELEIEVEERAENFKGVGKHFSYQFNNLEYMKENQSIYPNNSKVANTVDISDITRRLQKIKEDVLNATNKRFLTAPNMNCDETSRHEEKPKKLIESFAAKTDRAVDLDLNAYNGIKRKKTIEENFDATTQQTTLKVTIKNSDLFKSEDNESNIKSNNTPLKETHISNVASATKAQTTVINKSSLPTPVALKSAQIPTTTNFSTLRTTKIIKPNKVINTNVDLKRRELSQSNETSKANKVPRQDENTQSMNSIDNSRLITSIDQVKHMCQVAPFIISVQNSPNESSEDDCGGCDTVSKPLNEYNDIASPLSLNLESPSPTPLRSNSPIDICSNTQNSADSEKKPTQTFNIKTNTIKAADLKQVENTNKTPLAVRHLPAAAQSEYRRLVHRMKLLENKRKSTTVDDTNHNHIATKKERVSLARQDENKADAESANKTSLVKKVLVRNANNNNNTSITNLSESTKPSTAELVKVHKTKVLRSYENLYVKIGAGIVNNLDKSLKLVEEAKRAKISKLKIENRIRELKAEMEVLQSQHKDEQQKISLIYPTICTTNEIISSLKQKRSKVFKAANNLGKTLKGNDYRLKNDLKERINLKSKQLAIEIKMVNSLKIQDSSSIADKPKQNTMKELADNKKSVDSKKQSTTNESNEQILNPETKTTNDMSLHCGQEEQENTENFEETKNNIDLSQISTDKQVGVGGNTEFQNTEPSNIPNNNNLESDNRSTLETCGDIKCKGTEEKTSLTSYSSPLEHFRNIDSNVDPNGIICPYDLMGHCEDVGCKYVHIFSGVKS